MLLFQVQLLPYFILYTHTHTHTHTTETVICGEWDKKQDKAIQLRHNTRDINDGSYDISWFIYIFLFTFMTSPNTDISGQLVWCLTAAASTYDHKNRWHRCPHLTHNRGIPMKDMYIYGKKINQKKNGLEYTCYHTNHIMYLTHMSIPG